MYQKLILLVFVVWTMSCKKDETVLPPVVSVPSLLEQFIPPATTDENINVYTGNHYVYLKRDIALQNKLCIFSPVRGPSLKIIRCLFRKPETWDITPLD